ncbi:MAG: hypothetical protein E7179_03270 [Erysipelotrichaceae bacterium]|jgi:hypothetical protein|nr:hypothetical protein [Erysipelotrichaceae bacterium]
MTLLEVRKALKWSRQQAYKYLGISPFTYRKYEDENYKENERARYDRYVAELLEALDSVRIKPLIDCTSDDFASLRNRKAYLVDKTLLIKELIEGGQSTILLTRPRRFGKSLNLSMLRYFFDQKADPSLFDGLSIKKEERICAEHQNKYPTVFLTMKDVEGITFESMKEQLADVISSVILGFPELLESDKLDDVTKATIKALRQKQGTLSELKSSLKTLSYALSLHYGTKAIILIDEYDHPLSEAAKGGENGYYDEALDLIGGMLSAAFKSNPFMERGVLTGCLRVSKESIFSGLNNIAVYTLLDARFQEFFGFTETEVKTILADYDMMDKYEEVKAYYDGYVVAKTSLYCPYDVMNYVSDHLADLDADLKYYWANAGEYEFIRSLLRNSKPELNDDIGALIMGKEIKKNVNLMLTYRNLALEPDNVFSLLLASGYLVSKGKEGEAHLLSIPNKEVRYVFENDFEKWVGEKASEQGKNGQLMKSLLEGDFKEATAIFSSFLWDTIGIHDYSRPEKEREGFYHGTLLGYLGGGQNERYKVACNKEGGLGYLDIAISDSQTRTGVIIECKYANDGDLNQAIETALLQIDKNRYDDFFRGYETIRKIGVAFHRKSCQFAVGE